MAQKTYSIFGAGASGLYTAWRLLDGKTKGDKSKSRQLVSGDTLELYDWGKYDFSREYPGSRAAGARVWTWHYQDDKANSYLELGGMRYSEWKGDNGALAGGHRLVTTVIKQMGLDQYSVPFNESTNPLFYLRTKNMYLADITSSNPAPYHVDHYGADDSPDTGFNTVENLAGTEKNLPQTRAAWCEFYQQGRIAVDLPESSVYKKGQLFRDIGYWNLMFDQLGSEGFGYTSDGNGYTSNVINWNSAVALQANNEFTPGTEYRTLTTGYSSMFNALFEAIVKLAKAKGVKFDYHPDTRLHSILKVDNAIRYALATRANPNKKSASKTTDAAWLAMPRYALDLVAQATRYEAHEGLDVLNHQKVQLYLQSAILQPSYKVGMFFDQQWWTDTTNSALQYPAPIASFEVTQNVLDQLAKAGFPANDIAAMKNDVAILETPYASAASFIGAVEHSIQQRLTVKQEEQLLAAAARNTIGPSVTDTPIRQVVYFGNNARDPKARPARQLRRRNVHRFLAGSGIRPGCGTKNSDLGRYPAAGGPAQGAFHHGEGAAPATGRGAFRAAIGLHRRAGTSGNALHGLVIAALQCRVPRLCRALRCVRRAAENSQALAIDRRRGRRYFHRRRNLFERSGLGGRRLLYRRIRAQRLFRDRTHH
jgi:hypothetical protein